MSEQDPAAADANKPAEGAAPSGTAPDMQELKSKAADVLGDVKSGFETAKAKKEPYGLFAFAAAICTLTWLMWIDSGALAFWNLKLWSVFILASVALVFAPMVRGALKISEHRAHQLATAGACGMIFCWVAFLLPDIQSNQAFFGTFATAFAGIAAWMAPGRPSPVRDPE